MGTGPNALTHVSAVSIRSGCEAVDSTDRARRSTGGQLASGTTAVTSRPTPSGRIAGDLNHRLFGHPTLPSPIGLRGIFFETTENGELFGR